MPQHDLDAPITQAAFGELVGITQQAVSDLMQRGIIAKGQPAQRWLHAYCNHLRETAAGRMAMDDSVDLVTERALLAREQRERIAMKNAQDRGELAPRALLTQVLAGVAPRVVAKLDTIMPSLRRRGSYASADLQFVEKLIADTRNAIAKISLAEVLSGSSEDDDAELLRDGEEA